MYVASNPEGADTLLIDREISDMRDRLDRSANADPIDFSAYPNLAVGDLAEKVRRFRPDVLHLAAHGEDDALALAHPVDGSVALDGRKLAALLAAVSVKPKLIVLNACSSDGMAAELAAAGAADFVIGTDAPISNDGARAMAASLYQRLADGASVADAFTVARTNLDLIDAGEVGATLHPVQALEAARAVKLVDPMRIVACLPVIEEWLDAELAAPGRGFRPEMPKVQFGVAGSPAAARQTVFFTDDETVTKPKGGSLEEARSWIVESQPWKGEIWMPDAYCYYGDMSWYVAVTTTDRRVVSTAATTVEALRRYYFDELWRGQLPKVIADVVLRSLACLELHGGSRRGRKPVPRAERGGKA
jgi:hypothetical protein